jgi:putative heme degradation protein
MEEHKLRVYENRVLRRIFGPKSEGEEARADWRKLDNEKLLNLYSSPHLGSLKDG